MVAATLFAAALIAGAYVLGSGAAATPVVQASTEAALLQEVAARDSNGDGLPDWEKSLYGIPLDSTTTDYFHLGMTDGEAVARGLIVPKAIADVPAATSTVAPPPPNVPRAAASGTLTDTFAKNFITLYLAAVQANNGAPLSQTQMSDIENQSLTALSASIVPAPDFKSASNLTVSGTGPAALTSFAVAAENVMRTQGVQLPKSELQYLQAALSGDTSALGDISKLATAYRNVAAGLAALPVPQELAGTDLSLINAMARVGEAASDFARLNTDPLATMLALEQYPKAVLAMATAFQSIGSIYASEGVTLASGTPGASFVNVMQDVRFATSTAPTP